MTTRRHFLQTFSALSLGFASAFTQAQHAAVTLLNVSYDLTREFYVDFNAAFGKHWKQKTGQDVTIKQTPDAFGGWANAVKVHFADGGTFDQIYTKK